MNMVGHHHPSYKLIQPQFFLPINERIRHNLSNPIIPKPHGPRPRGTGLLACYRERSEKPPSHEKSRPLRVPVRKIPNVVGHKCKLPQRSKFSQEKGGVVLETAMFLPILFLLLFGTVELARITYTYYTLQKIMYSIGRNAGTQQGVNFCDSTDPSVTAAKNLAITGTIDGTTDPIVANLTPDMVQIRIERYNTVTGALDQCDCSVNGCDTAAGGLPPDYIVVSMPNGYPFAPHIPFIPTDPIPLRPTVRVPYGGT
jgi:hypothetical protein